jgi:hypothetical protein
MPQCTLAQQLKKKQLRKNIMEHLSVKLKKKKEFGKEVDWQMASFPRAALTRPRGLTANHQLYLLKT